MLSTVLMSQVEVARAGAASQGPVDNKIGINSKLFRFAKFLTLPAPFLADFLLQIHKLLYTYCPAKQEKSRTVASCVPKCLSGRIFFGYFAGVCVLVFVLVFFWVFGGSGLLIF